MPDPKPDRDEVPAEDLEQVTGADIPVTSEEAASRPARDDQRTETDQAANEPDPWKQKPT